ncbi:DUF5313 family protein [Pseudonocardia pini]|uniref:DUF5313 family protein n=1 Tax=Pseudonocardia pini TaxID=2758030 RepID=UPI0015F0893E|nr:DUF5313 family protein [Pseudonocardia pini]
MTEIVRPDPLHWVGYALGAGLPARHRAWVLHDVTAPTWALRHLARAVVQLAPFAAALLLFLPFPLWVRLAGVLMGAAIGLFYSFAWMEASAEHRVIKAGYPEGTAAATRRERRHTPTS